MASEGTGVYVCVWGVRGVYSDRWRGAGGDRPQEQDGLSSSADSNSRDSVGHGAFPSHLQEAKVLSANHRAGERGRDRRQGGNKLGATWQQPHNRSPLNMRQREWEWEPGKKIEMREGKKKEGKKNQRKRLWEREVCLRKRTRSWQCWMLEGLSDHHVALNYSPCRLKE